MALLADPRHAQQIVMETMLRLQARTAVVRPPVVREARPPDLGLLEFVEEAWPILEPSVPFRRNWHIESAADHFEAITFGQLDPPLLQWNVPPGFMKSLMGCVFWPAWEWGPAHMPWTRWLFNSYDIKLSMRDTVRWRRLLDSDWYRGHWGGEFTLTGDQNTKQKVENNRTGWRIAASVNSANTGEHAHRIVVDDPHNVKKVESDLERESTVTWWRETMPDRGIIGYPTAKVLVGQRTHEQDVFNDWQEREGGRIHLLEVQNELDEDEHRPACPVGSHDPRTQLGELAWPEVLDQQATVRKKTTEMTAYAYSAQFQQRPSPRHGKLLDPAWWHWPLPEGIRLRTWKRVQFWDLAWSEKQTADYTVGGTWYVESEADPPRLYLHAVWRQRVGEQDLAEQIAAEIAAQQPQLVALEAGIFEKARAVEQLIRDVRRLLREVHDLVVPIEGVPVDGDKVLRARILEGPGKGGYLYGNRSAPWWSDFQSEVGKFPKSAHDDQVDMASGGVAAAYRLLRLLKMREAASQPAELRFRTGAPSPRKQSELEQMLSFYR